MIYYEIWKDMDFEQKCFLSDPIDKDGNELYGWQFTMGEKYNPPLPVSVKIKEKGNLLPILFGGLDVPYINQLVKEIIIDTCRDEVQIIPVKIEGTPFQYYIINALNLLDAISESSEIEYFTKEEELKYPKISKSRKFKSVSNLVINKDKIKNGEKIFRLKNWSSGLYIRGDVKEIIESSVSICGISFKKIPTA